MIEPECCEGAEVAMLKPRIMIVEDERIESLSLQDSLGRLGYSVSAVATTGAEAVRLAGESMPDLVLMDIKISGSMDGIETAKALQAARDIPVVYISALSDRETLRRALVSSPFGYLVKPFDEAELRTTVEIALYKHRMQRELKMAKEAATLAKGDFLARVTTAEPPSPMNGILGLAELAQAAGLPPEQREPVESIRRSARALMCTLGDTLDIPRSPGTEAVEFSLRSGLDSLLEPLAVQAQSKGLHLEWSVEPDVPDLLRGDEDTLLQALRNVAVHAVKFTPHGSVKVWVGRADPSSRAAPPDPADVPGSADPAGEADAILLLFEVRGSATSAPSAPSGQDGDPAPLRPRCLGLDQARELVRGLGSVLRETGEPGQPTTCSFAVWLKTV
jgi:CheY-like chemotaxis protein